MANTLILNQPQVFNGTGTLTFTIPTAGAWNAQVQATFPSAPPVDLDAAGSGTGAGSGPGGGGEGFTGGDLGLGHGGVGQGFGVGNSYQQPPSYGSNSTAAPAATTSGLSIVVNKNGSPIYTSNTPALAQSALQFKTSFLANINDIITIVLSSSVSSDKQLSGVTSTTSIGQGF